MRTLIGKGWAVEQLSASRWFSSCEEPIQTEDEPFTEVTQRIESVRAYTRGLDHFTLTVPFKPSIEDPVLPLELNTMLLWTGPDEDDLLTQIIPVEDPVTLQPDHAFVYTIAITL